ncbi:protein FAM184A-like [Dendronephthya gigantea]|uniref:protein FAM184A-like n=1 Tax=Dendronephthya gigantea TaxID=151771 RepID=UPI0010696EF6|nr:protein FAM184A-like [Dendronephthya gigantea]XP_028390866.1 protein FAM184A-like [Dendronephthya gigantea]
MATIRRFIYTRKMAATKSTTFGKMPHKNGTFIGNFKAGNTTDVSPDLHLKMSKKIAQLTKVVYALNTKNDEQDSIVGYLKERHENEMQELLRETKGRVNELQQRIEIYEQQKADVRNLEQRFREESEKRSLVVREFEQYKISVKEKEETLRTEREMKANENVKQLLETKNSFEKQLEDFRKTRELLEKDKDKAMEELVGKHHEELEELMKAHRVRYDEVVKDKEKLKQDLEAKIKDLSNSPEVFRAEREKIEREYIAKLDKLKTLYERELGHAKEATIKAEASVKTFQQKEIDLRNSWKNQEKQYKDRILSLRKDLDSTKDQILELEGQLSDVSKEAALKGEGSMEMKGKLDEAVKSVNSLTNELRQSKNELQVLMKRSEGLTDELSNKTRSHHKLEATCLNQEQSINELKKQLDLSKDKSSKLESDLKLLENNKESLATDSQQQLRKLEKNVEALEKEKQDIKFKYIQEVVLTKDESAKKENNLKSQHEQELVNLKNKYEQALEEFKMSSETLLSQQKAQLDMQSQQEQEKLMLEKDAVIEAKNSELQKVQKLCEETYIKVEALSGQIHESEIGLGSASSRISRLNEIVKQKQTEISSLEAELASSKTSVDSLKNEIEATNNSLEKERKNAKLSHQRNLEELRKELTQEWSERLKSENSSLRALLNQQHEDGQHAALRQLSELKEEEKEEIRVNSEKNMAILQSKICQLEQELKETSSRLVSSERTFRESASQQRRTIEEQRSRETLEYNEKLKNIEEKYRDEIALLKEIKEQELKELETKLKNTHDEETLSQLKASQLSLEVVRSQAEIESNKKMAEERVKFEKEKDVLEGELLRRRREEIGKVKNDFETQLSVLKLQVEKSDELRTKETDRHAAQIEELSSTIRQNQLQISELDRELSESKNQTKQLHREIELKGQEILNVRREANSHIRKSEEKLAKAHQKEMDSQVAEHLRETQNMVNEFNRAQELLKDKVSALQLMLEEAEARFRNRPSRDEDVEVLQSLKTALTERDLELKKMLDEKRYYQLELLNRETNFNKVFKSAPNIGVINPLQHKKKQGKEQYSGQGSTMMLTSSRLEPMPVSNLSVHEKKLNNTSPLPPAPPKKMSATKRTTVY